MSKLTKKKCICWKNRNQFSNLMTILLYYVDKEVVKYWNVACWNEIGSMNQEKHSVFRISKKVPLFRKNHVSFQIQWPFIFKMCEHNIRLIQIWVKLVAPLALNLVLWGSSTKSIQFTPENQFFEFSLLCAWIARISKVADLIPIGYGLAC